MKNIFFCFLFVGFSSFGQKNLSDSKFKKITETETYRVTYSDGKKHVFTSEINEYHYDTLGKKTSHLRKTFYNRKLYSTVNTNYFYNENAKIDYINSFILEDSLTYKTIYSYLNGNLHKKTASYKTKTSQVQYHEENFYDENEKLKKSNYLYSEKDLYTGVYKRKIEAEFRYNKKEQTTESNWTKSDSSYKYNRIVHLRNRKGFRKKDKVYNKNNKLIKTTTFKYVLDNRENWVIWKHYEKKQLTKAVYREIEYYD